MDTIDPPLLLRSPELGNGIVDLGLAVPVISSAPIGDNCGLSTLDFLADDRGVMLPVEKTLLIGVSASCFAVGGVRRVAGSDRIAAARIEAGEALGSVACAASRGARGVFGVRLEASFKGRPLLLLFDPVEAICAMADYCWRSI